jgi:outer membrane immunogenic protein
MKMLRAALTLTALLAATAASAADFGGFRAGLTLGIADHTASWTDTDYYEYGGTLATPYVGLTYGLAAGYDYQAGSGVIGAEISFDLSSMEKETDYSDGSATRTDAFNNVLMLRARAGFVAEQMLLFVTGGIARPSFDHSFIYIPPSPTGDWKEFSNNKVGYTFGFGVERVVMGGLSVRAEYTRTRFPLVDAKNVDNSNMQVDDQLEGFRLGVDYRF